MNKITKAIGYFMLFITLTVVSHWVIINTYVRVCAPMTWLGPFYTFVSMGSPLCHFLNFAQHELSKHYITLWSGAAVGFASWLTLSNNKKEV